MAIKVEINNLQKVEKFVVGLSKKEDKELSKTNEQMMNAIKKSAKLRAPRDTGELVHSIKEGKTISRGKTHQRKLQVTAPHAIFQEEGFKPHFAFIRNSSKLVPGVYFVKKNTPFVKPAIEANLGRFAQNLNSAVGRAIR